MKRWFVLHARPVSPSKGTIFTGGLGLLGTWRDEPGRGMEWSHIPKNVNLSMWRPLLRGQLNLGRDYRRVHVAFAEVLQNILTVFCSLYMSAAWHIGSGQQVLCIDSLSVKWGQPVIQRLSWGAPCRLFLRQRVAAEDFFSGWVMQCKKPARTSTPFGSTGQKTTPRWWLSILETFDFGGQPRRRCHNQPACAGQAGRPLSKWVEIMRWWFYDIMLNYVCIFFFKCYTSTYNYMYYILCIYKCTPFHKARARLGFWVLYGIES